MLETANLFRSQQLSPSRLSNEFYPAFHHLWQTLSASFALMPQQGSWYASIFTQTDCIILRRQRHPSAFSVLGVSRAGVSKCFHQRVTWTAAHNSRAPNILRNVFFSGYITFYQIHKCCVNIFSLLTKCFCGRVKWLCGLELARGL